MNGFDAERGRRVLAGCFAIFALPFFIAGVSVLNAGVHAIHRHEANAAILLGVGVAFTAFAAGILALMWFGLRRSQADAQLRSANPMQPWLWRDDWSARRIADTSASATVALFVFALMWNAIALPVAIVIGRSFPRTPQAALALIFPAVGLVLLAAAIYSALQRRKFGRSFCEIDRLPIEIGQRFSGAIVHRGTDVPAAGYRIALRCVERIVTGSRRNRNVTEDVLWENEQQVSGALAAPSPVGMRVPFAFDIPADAPSTESRAPNDAVLWRLTAAAALPGIDYKATFELPVFETAGSAAAHHALRRDEAARRELPPSSRVSIAPLPSGGIELRVAPLRDVGPLVTFLVIAAVWFGAIALMWRLGAPHAVAAVFSLFGLVILAIAVDFFAGTSFVRADRSGLRARRAILGMSSTKSIDAAQVESIDPKVGGHVGRHPYFDVEARLRDGSTRTLARYFESRSDAETVAAKLWDALR